MLKPFGIEPRFAAQTADGSGYSVARSGQKSLAQGLYVFSAGHVGPMGLPRSRRGPRHFVPGYDQPVPPGQKPFSWESSVATFGA
jgi:hypothetical protein